MRQHEKILQIPDEILNGINQNLKATRKNIRDYIASVKPVEIKFYNNTIMTLKLEGIFKDERDKHPTEMPIFSINLTDENGKTIGYEIRTDKTQFDGKWSIKCDNGETYFAIITSESENEEAYLLAC